jgi:heavy metal sensor kinase
MNKRRPLGWAKPGSLRVRITAWYVAFFSVLFVLFGVFLYQVLSRSLIGRLDEELRSQADTAAALFDDEMEEMRGDAGAAARDAVANMRLPGSRAAVIADGRVLSATAPISPAELRGITAEAGAAGGADRVLALPAPGRYGEQAAVHRTNRGGHFFLIVAVAPLDPIAADLLLVRRTLWFAMPLLLALAALGGYWVSSRGLAPVGWMAEQARQIGGASLDRRLEIGNAARELTTLAESFNELLGRLDRSFDTMRRFVADASHELRTPIAVIRGEADVALSRERTAVEYRAALATILDEARRISRLVDDLLNLARADAGHVKLRVEEFYLNDLVGECCRSIESLAAARQIEVTCATNGDVSFRGDEELLRRLVVNLLDNAIRYTPPGGKVSVAMESGRGNLRLTVSDTGPGIAPEAARHVFDRFYRGDKARSREEGGFGLGLAIVKWIAESHRGTVELASRPGAGTTFTVTLPG